LHSFRIPHKPPTGSLRVLHAPARQGGIRCASKTKNKLRTNEFASNPPFSNIYPTFHGNDGFKKKLKTWNFFEKVLNSGTLARKLFKII